MSKVSVIGAGKVGEIVAFGLVNSGVVNEVTLIDIVEGLPQGKGLDMYEATPVLGSNTKVNGSNDYAAIKGSDIVVVPAGVPRKPGMDRMDLLKVNLKICKSVVDNIKEYAPDAMICYVANPVDVMTYAAFRFGGFPSNRIFGMAGVLDTARYRTFISMEANVSVKDISAMVLGGHGDSMVPLPRYTTVGGVPITNFLDQEKIDAIVERTRKGGGEIVKLLGYSGYYAPGIASVEMVQAILNNERRVLPAVAYLEGQYGFDDIFAGVPVILGENGIEQILEVELNDEEKSALDASLTGVKKGIEEMKKLLDEM
ncbi:MAG: malate dehydrogenase [bacterium]|nr:malate dehydrogenase [bacterium]